MSRAARFSKGASRKAVSFFYFWIGVLSADGQEAVRFVSWNVKNYTGLAAAPAPVQPGRESNPKPPHEAAAVVRILAGLKPDIVGLCEIGQEADLRALQADLKAAGFDLPHAEWLAAADKARHLALLSRWPVIARQHRADLTYLLDERRIPIQRGILDATISVSNSWPLRFIGVHLKSRRDVPEADENLMRRNEAHVLRTHIDTVLTADPHACLVVYGDFNETQDKAAVKAVRGLRGADTFLTDLTPRDATGETWTYHFAESDEYSRIDFVFASKKLVPLVEKPACVLYSGTDWRMASDHRAALTVIHPPPEKKPPRKPD